MKRYVLNKTKKPKMCRAIVTCQICGELKKITPTNASRKGKEHALRTGHRVEVETHYVQTYQPL